MGLVDVRCSEVRFLNEEEGVLTVYIFRIEILRVPEGENPMNKREV